MMEKVLEIEGKHLNIFQKLYFRSESDIPSEKADSLRGMLSELENFNYPPNVCHQLSQSSLELIKSNIHKKLSAIVDDFNSNTGLNNYAEQALSYVKHQVNESQKWQCRLRLDQDLLDEVKSSDVTDQTEDLSCFASNDAGCFEELVAEEQSLDPESELADSVQDASNDVREQHANDRWPSKRNFEEQRPMQKKISSRCTERNVEDVEKREIPAFRTAKDQLIIENKKKHSSNGAKFNSLSSASYGSNKKSLGTRSGMTQKFIPPVMKNGNEVEPRGPKQSESEVEVQDERLKNICPKMIELIESEIMDHGPPIQWDDIAGLEFAKTTIKEIVVWPMLRPDLFTGLRGPPKGLLLFGPPGTGKTLIGKCVASQSKATFFNISASSLTSKWIGDGEKMVRALFAVARTHLPAVIFIDEIDSILTQRSESEHESSRRIKTEFLVQLDGATTFNDEQLLIIGATNRPQELDEAARRRLVKRLYIPLPEACARLQIVKKLLATQVHCVSEYELLKIGEMTAGYSGADMTNLCKEASLGPIRSLGSHNIQTISLSDVRAIHFDDFKHAAKQVRASVSQKDLNLYLDWNENFGSLGNM